MSELLLFGDTETTDMVDWKNPSDGPQQPHVLQIAGLLADASTRQIVQSLDLIIRPEGWEIADEAFKVHGISKEYAMDVGVPESLAVEIFLDLAIDRTCIFHGANFDKRIVRIATKRYFNENIQDAWKDNQFECTGLLSKAVMDPAKLEYKGFRFPKLDKAYQFFTGNELENAHSAMADAMACQEIYWAIQDGVNPNEAPVPTAEGIFN